MPSNIVIDEVVGQFLTSVWFPSTWLYVVLGFAFFRFFDIVKPWPIRWIDRDCKHSLSTLFDDLVAAIFAVGLLLGCGFLFLGT